MNKCYHCNYNYHDFCDGEVVVKVILWKTISVWLLEEWSNKHRHLRPITNEKKNWYRHRKQLKELGLIVVMSVSELIKCHHMVPF